MQRIHCLSRLDQATQLIMMEMKMMTISHHQTCKALHPLGRPGVAEEVATAIAFLASKVMMMVFS